jgi:hypothetical protein
MKKINLKKSLSAAKVAGNERRSPMFSIAKVAGVFMAITLFIAPGCRKLDKNDESYYGYGKLTVQCESKCHISFGTPDKMNVYDVDSNTGIYYFRYQTKYNMDIFITPTDRDQNIIMNVYSREQKQIFHNAANRKVNVVWESKILVP